MNIDVSKQKALCLVLDKRLNVLMNHMLNGKEFDGVNSTLKNNELILDWCEIANDVALMLPGVVPALSADDCESLWNRINTAYPLQVKKRPKYELSVPEEMVPLATCSELQSLPVLACSRSVVFNTSPLCRLPAA